MEFPDTPEGRVRAARAKAWEAECERCHQEWIEENLCPCGNAKLREQPTYIRDVDFRGATTGSRMVYVKCDHKGGKEDPAEWDNTPRKPASSPDFKMKKFRG